MSEDAKEEYGWIELSELVTDGHMTWFERQRYLYYSPDEAKALFAEHIKNNNWEVVE